MKTKNIYSNIFISILLCFALLACNQSDDDSDVSLSFATSTGISITPGATEIPTHTPIVVTFTNLMNNSSIQNSFFIVEGAKSSTSDILYDSETCNTYNALEAGLECSGESTTNCTLSPKLFLSSETSYSLCVTPNVTDANGNSFDGATVSFTTAAVQTNQNACSDTSIQVFTIIKNIPFDITNTRKISKYRSCLGHSMNDEFEPTPYSSLKHYIFGPEGHDNCYRAKAYAPFNGTVIGLLIDTDVSNDDGYVEAGCDETSSNAYVAIRSIDYPRFIVQFEHANPKPGLAVGDTVTAGEEIAYAIYPTPENGSWDLLFGTVDISNDLFINEESGVSLYSYCTISEFLSDNATAIFANYGIEDMNELLFTKAEREADECQGTMWDNGQVDFDSVYWDDSDHWVYFD